MSPPNQKSQSTASLDEMRAELQRLAARVDLNEAKGKEQMATFTESLTGVEQQVRDVKHALGNNTQLTEGNQHFIRQLQNQVDGVSRQVTESTANSAEAVSLMKNLTALNTVANLAKKGLVWFVPLASAVAGLVIAIRSIFR